MHVNNMTLEFLKFYFVNTWCILNIAEQIGHDPHSQRIINFFAHLYFDGKRTSLWVVLLFNIYYTNIKIKFTKYPGEILVILRKSVCECGTYHSFWKVKRSIFKNTILWLTVKLLVAVQVWWVLDLILAVLLVFFPS